MLTADFDFVLPKHLIATHPTCQRDEAKLLVVDRTTQTWEHHSIADLHQWIEPGDLWILNNTKVFPARFFTADQKIELLLLEETSPQHWLCLASPGKKTRAGAKLTFQSSLPKELPLTGEILRTLETGERVVRFHRPFILEHFGQVPLPPYIEQQRKTQNFTFQEDKERYQTVYAQHIGSVAAPTAGLHLTPQLLEKIPHAFVTLHVGLGTFRPVKTEAIQDHEMHREKFQITPEVAQAIATAKRRVAVGTTSCRVLETLALHSHLSGSTNIFIYPPYTFKNTNALLTNFHLPRSTLLMLVSAFLENNKPASARFSRGIDFMKKIYEDAIQQNYRFFSYGDAMLIL